jgi:preprotein translocase subunit SecE
VSGRSCICVVMVINFASFYVFLMDFGTVLTVWYF